MKLSVYIITLNEEKRLEKTLQAASKVADEIIIVDSGSNDRTKKIALNYNVKFIYNEWKSYSDQKHFAQEQCSNDWVLNLDADEVLSLELIESINKEKEDFKYKAYYLDLTDMNPKDKKPRLFGRKWKLVRLYDKNLSNMPEDVMNKDRVKVGDGIEIGRLKGLVYHYPFLSIEQAVQKYNLHSSELVKTAIKNNTHYSRFRLAIEFPRQFISYYFFKRYFVYGTYGFIQAMILANFRFLKIAKVINYWNRSEDLE
jgi:glycosyltransferase involved in cell wall biosynthesis